MKHPPAFLLLLVGAILVVHLVSSVPNQHQNNRLKAQKSERAHHAKQTSLDRQHHVKPSASDRHHVDRQLHVKKLGKPTKQHHEITRAHGTKPRVHPGPVVHHAPSKHHSEGGKRHLEIQKPPKPFLQPPLLLPKHQRPVKHHGKQERNNKHR